MYMYMYMYNSIYICIILYIYLSYLRRSFSSPQGLGLKAGHGAWVTYDQLQGAHGNVHIPLAVSWAMICEFCELQTT